MKVVVFASTKGGVGCSTLAFNVAIHAARAGVGIQLADVDPQKSLLNICLRRRDMPELVDDNPMILENVDTIARTVADLEASGYARDFLLVDTPGSFMGILREAIAAADVVVLPLQPSPFDYLAQEDAADLVKKLGKRGRTLFVVNRVDARSDLVKQTLRAIAPLSPHKPVVIANRVDYAKAALTARAGVEINKEAAAEIGGLWQAINRIIRKADDEQDVQRKHGRSRREKVAAKR